MNKTEEIIKVAIEGGWKYDFEEKEFLPDGTDYGAGLILLRGIFCDPKFFQAIGKAKGWDKQKMWLNPYTPKGRYIPGYNLDRWMQEAMNFYEINLTQSFDDAINYLYELIK